MSNKHIYPRLSVAEVVSSLTIWGLPVSQEQISRPTPEFVEGIYCACLRQITDITHEILFDPVQDSVAAVSEEKELYTGPLTNILIIYHLSRIANAARIDGFSAEDIYHPTKERTLDILSALINFVKFSEGLNESYLLRLRQESSEVRVELNKAKENYADISRKVNSIKAKLAEDQPRCEELKIENEQLRARLFATKEVQKTMVEKVERLKADKAALIHKKEAINGEIGSIEDNLSSTRMRLVQSPERIKRTINQMSQTVVADKKTLSLTEGKARDLKAKVDALHVIEQELRGCIEQLQTIQKENQALQECENEVEELKDQFTQKVIEKNEFVLRKERTQKQLDNAQDKLDRTQRQAEEKRAASQHTIERLQQSYDEMVIERKSNDQQVEEVRSQTEKIHKEMAEHLRQSEAELNELLTEYWNIRHAVELYMETLASKLNLRVSVITQA